MTSDLAGVGFLPADPGQDDLPGDQQAGGHHDGRAHVEAPVAFHRRVEGVQQRGLVQQQRNRGDQQPGGHHDVGAPGELHVDLRAHVPDR